MDITIDPLSVARQCERHGIWNRFGDPCPVCQLKEDTMVTEIFGTGVMNGTTVEMTIPAGITRAQREKLARWLRRVAKDVEVFGIELSRKKEPVVYREDLGVER